MSKHIKEEYYLTIIEGISPMTRVPSTHFRLAGVGVLKHADCLVETLTPSKPPVSKPSTEPPYKPCGLQVTPTSFKGKEGDEITYTLTHSNTSGIVDIGYSYDSGYLDQVEDSKFRLMAEGTQTIKVAVIYEDGQECTSTVSITIEEGRGGDYQESEVLVVCPFQTVEIGQIEVSGGKPSLLTIGMRFTTISGAAFPDLNIEAPNGETFGYQAQFLNTAMHGEDKTNKASTKATYTGYAPTNHDEEYQFTNPMNGTWKFFAQNTGGNEKSEVTFYVSEGAPLTITYPGPSC